MENKSKIDLVRYNYETHQKEPLGEVHVYDLVRSMTDEQMAYLLSEWFNGYRDQSNGEKIGKIFQGEHRTLQASAIRWVFGFLKGICKGVKYTDARNEMAIQAAQKVTAQVEDGSINYGWMI